jgi:hypothetical protein
MEEFIVVHLIALLRVSMCLMSYLREADEFDDSDIDMRKGEAGNDE